MRVDLPASFLTVIAKPEGIGKKFLSQSWCKFLPKLLRRHTLQDVIEKRTAVVKPFGKSVKPEAKGK